MKENNIDFVLKKLKKRIWTNKIINSLVVSIFISTIAVFIMSIFSHIFPIVNVFQKGLLILVLGSAIGLVYGILNGPTMKETASIGDSLGFKERFSTYLEYKNKISTEDSLGFKERFSIYLADKNIHDEVIKVFIEETESAVEHEEPLKKYPIKVDGKKLIISIIVLALSIGIFFIPSMNRDIAKEKEDIGKSLEDEIEQIEELKEYIEDDESIEEVEKKEILEQMDRLEKKLSKTFDYKEAAFHIAEAQEEIDRILGEHTGYDQFGDKVSNDGDSQLSSGKNISNIDGKTLDDNAKEEIHEDEQGVEGAHKSYDKESNGGKAPEEVNINLENMKDSLLAKNDDGFESIGGKDKPESFTEGQNKNSNSGELTKDKAKDTLSGGGGTASRDSKDGVGGSGVKGDKSSVSKKGGKLEKGKSSDKITEESKDVLNIEGQKSEKGQIKTVHSNKGIGTNGMDEVLKKYYRQFRKDKLKYVEKYSIPEESKSLVKTYFEKLLEE